MTLPLGFCQPQLGLDCTVHEPSALKGTSTATRRLSRRPSRRTYLRPAVFHVHAAATAARSQSDATNVQNTASATDQRNSWQVAASNIVSSFQRHRRENHLPLCRAFGVESLTRLRVCSMARAAYTLEPPTTPAPVRSGDLTLQDRDVAPVHCNLQDVFNCMCLSEGVYKVVDFGEDKATEILGAILEGFPPGLVSLKRVEWSRPDSNHRQGSQSPVLSSCCPWLHHEAPSRAGMTGLRRRVVVMMHTSSCCAACVQAMHPASLAPTCTACCTPIFKECRVTREGRMAWVQISASRLDCLLHAGVCWERLMGLSTWPSWGRSRGGTWSRMLRSCRRPSGLRICCQTPRMHRR